jgi:histidine triad (HIT) family protein
MEKKCIFCNFKETRLNEEVIWENEEFIAFLDKRPVKPGHTLLIPKKHIDFLFNLDDESYHRILNVAKRLYQPIIKATGSRTMGMKLSGFTVFHAHIHLIPRDRSGETFFQTIPPEADKKELREIGDRIRAEIKKIGM